MIDNIIRCPFEGCDEIADFRIGTFPADRDVLELGAYINEHIQPAIDGLVEKHAE